MPGPHLLQPNLSWPERPAFLTALTTWAMKQLGPLTPLHKAYVPFAKEVGASRATIARLVGGLGSPRPAFRDRLAEKLGVDPTTFQPLEAQPDAPVADAQPEAVPLPGITEAPASTTQTPEGHPNRRIVPGVMVDLEPDEGVEPDEDPERPDRTRTIRLMRLYALGRVGRELATARQRTLGLWVDAESVILPVRIVGDWSLLPRVTIHVPGGIADNLQSYVVSSSAVLRALVMTSPGGVTRDVTAAVHTLINDLRIQRDNATHTAQVGLAQQQDVLLPLRDVLLPLDHLHDDLKILSVDVSDVSEDLKDQRLTHLSKRIHTARRGLQDLLKRFGSK